MTQGSPGTADDDVDVSVVAPVFDEAENLRQLHASLTSALAGLRYEILYVNDGSRDDGPRILDEIAAADPRARALHFRRNYGQTAAIAAGLDHSRGRVVVPIDADLQNDPADIPMLLKRLDEGFDVVSGWRKDRRDAAVSRVLPSFVANGLISLVSGVKLHDYGCTLKAYRREVMEGVRLYGEMHRFIPVYAHLRGARVTEMPVRHHPRTRGKSKYGIRRTYRVLLDLMVVKFLANYSTKPMHVFGGFGLACFVGAVFSAGAAAWLKWFAEIPRSFIQTPLPLLTVLLIVLGAMSILMGLLAELVVRTYYEASDRRTYELASPGRGQRSGTTR
jgi:glycosyltransferase involved in cell wall biosynthesis